MCMSLADLTTHWHLLRQTFVRIKCTFVTPSVYFDATNKIRRDNITILPANPLARHSLCRNNSSSENGLSSFIATTKCHDNSKSVAGSTKTSTFVAGLTNVCDDNSSFAVGIEKKFVTTTRALWQDRQKVCDDSSRFVAGSANDGGRTRLEQQERSRRQHWGLTKERRQQQRTQSPATPVPSQSNPTALAGQTTENVWAPKHEIISTQTTGPTDPPPPTLRGKKCENLTPQERKPKETQKGRISKWRPLKDNYALRLNLNGGGGGKSW